VLYEGQVLIVKGCESMTVMKSGGHESNEGYGIKQKCDISYEGQIIQNRSDTYRN
jgi:hypothetical protein